MTAVATRPVVPATDDSAATTPLKPRSKIPYHGLKDINGQSRLLTEIPTDWEAAKHKPLIKKDFSDAAVFYDMKAAQSEAKVLFYRQEASDCRTLGSAQDRKAAKRLLNMQKAMDRLTAALQADGVDTVELLARSRR